MTGSVDFAAVQWARKMTALIQTMTNLPPADLAKLGDFLVKLSNFRQDGGELTEPQLQVIMQGLFNKKLVKLETHKGGVYLEFTGSGIEYERLVVRPDGKIPNTYYELKKA
jgi:hypothetical protein